MMQIPQFVFASPIQSILLVEKMGHTLYKTQFKGSSLPGHLLHYVLEGHVVQECNGRRYELVPGSILWYHEDEWLSGDVLEAPWVFYSVNFVAPNLLPPPFEARLQYESPNDASPKLRNKFEALHSCWWEPRHDLQRALRCHNALLDILLTMLTPEQAVTNVGKQGHLWWEIESKLREDLSQDISLDGMQHMSNKSAATIARSCHLAVGLAPMQRIKQVRLSLARGLVQRSSLTFGEIASQVGYPRLHEFSRDFKKHFGISPSHERRRIQE